MMNNNKMNEFVSETSITVSDTVNDVENTNWDKLSKAPRALNISPQYLDFENVGDKVTCKYLGLDKITKRDGGNLVSLKVVKLLTESGVFVNAGISLVEELSRHCQIGDYIDIEFAGKSKTSKGNQVNKFNIYPIVTDV